jgi:hypothetical protein
MDMKDMKFVSNEGKTRRDKVMNGISIEEIGI